MFQLMQELSIVVWIVFNTVYGYRHFGYSKSKSFLLAATCNFLLWVTTFFLAWACNGFQNFGEQNAIRSYAVSPLVIWLQVKVFKIDWRDYFDCVSIGAVLCFAVAHIGCIFAGCCHGFEYAEGTLGYKIAMALTGTNMMPQQMYEVIGAFLVTIIVYIIAVRHNHHMGGRLLPIAFILFGTQRFFFEFLRDNKKLIRFKVMEGVFEHNGDKLPAYLGISELALWAVAAVIVGIVFLVIFNRMDRQKAEVEAA